MRISKLWCVLFDLEPLEIYNINGIESGITGIIKGAD